MQQPLPYAGVSAEEATGRGSGVDDAGLAEKVRIVQQSVQRARAAHPPPEGLSERTLPEAADAAARDKQAAAVAADARARVPREFVEAMLEEVGGLELAAIAGAIIAARDVRSPLPPKRDSLMCEVGACWCRSGKVRCRTCASWV